jgi:hypothetical protein
MHRLTTSWLGFGVLAATFLGEVSCGAPAELDESLFPGPNETGYADADGTGSTGTPLGGGGAGAGAPSGGSGGSTAAPPASAGAGNPVPPSGGGAPVGGGGSAQAGAAGGGSAPPASGGCPDDITVLFNRPITEGGCAGDACHVPGRTAPDLVSPNPETRLVDVLSQCEGRPYIGAGDSFLADKIAGSPPQCGLAMPFFMPQALSAADEQCILDWIDEVSGG